MGSYYASMLVGFNCCFISSCQMHLDLKCSTDAFYVTIGK